MLKGYSAPRVLLAEGDDAVRALLQIELKDHGFSVVAVDSADAASVQLEQRRFDLLLTDVQMPGRLSGLDLAHYAQRMVPVLPVIFLTGRGDLVHVPLRGRQLLIGKPFRFESILAGIRMLINFGGNPRPA